ncbi:hypothetical protein [Streptomyces sp. NPDC026673]|uniref:hypothetical protein n=1 Tax=Streptomyces sp. NPDC026673 TaxID=3155724 RepID=UPI00340FD4CB
MTVRRQPAAGSGDIMAAFNVGEAFVEPPNRECDRMWLLCGRIRAFAAIDGESTTAPGKVVPVTHAL